MPQRETSPSSSELLDAIDEVEEHAETLKLSPRSRHELLAKVREARSLAAEGRR